MKLLRNRIPKTNNRTIERMNKALKTFIFRAIIMFLGSILLIPGNYAAAQDLEVGLSGGGGYYLGDLNPGTHFKNIQVAYGVLARYNIDSRWSVKLGVTQGNISGNSNQTSFLPDRELMFSSTITDISAVAEFNFFPYFTGSKKNWITPYVYGGFGIFLFNPKANGYSLRDLGTEGQNIGYDGRKPYSTVSYGFPFGLGVKISLARKLGLQVYWEMHKTLSDYLDDVSTTYYLNGNAIDPANYEQFLSDPPMNHQPGMERGNSKTQDWYSFFGISLTYKFKLTGSKRCRDLER